MRRRNLLVLGAASAAVLAVAGGMASLARPGLADGRLSAGAREVFAAFARAILDGTLPSDTSARQAALAGLLDRIEQLIAALPPHAQSELSQLLSLLASDVGRRAFASLAAPWRDASVTQLQDTMQGMRHSTLALRQQAYLAMHDIVGAAYFSDASTWNAIGYPGPMAMPA